MPKELKLNDHKTVEVLSVDIDGKKYNIPLGTSLKVKEYRKLKKIKGDDDEGMFSFLASYIGKDVVEELTIDEIRLIFNAWAAATQEAGGISVGES